MKLILYNKQLEAIIRYKRYLYVIYGEASLATMGVVVTSGVTNITRRHIFYMIPEILEIFVEYLSGIVTD